MNTLLKNTLKSGEGMTHQLQTHVMYDFKEFLESGRIGSLDSQPSIQEILKFFGQPEFEEENENIIQGSNFIRLYYDNFEVRYIDSTFFQLAIYFRDVKTMGSGTDGAAPFKISWYSTVRKMGFEEIRKFLKANRINSKRIVFSLPEEDAGLAIEVMSMGITISFADRTKIDCIHYTPSEPGQFEYGDL